MPKTTSKRVQKGGDTADVTTLTTTQEPTDSSEISVNAKGEVSIKVKVYGIDPDTVVRESHRATLDLAKLFNLTIKSLSPDNNNA